MDRPLLPAKGRTAVRNPWLGEEVGWGQGWWCDVVGSGTAFRGGLHVLRWGVMT